MYDETEYIQTVVQLELVSRLSEDSAIYLRVCRWDREPGLAWVEKTIDRCTEVCVGVLDRNRKAREGYANDVGRWIERKYLGVKMRKLCS